MTVHMIHTDGAIVCGQRHVENSTNRSEEVTCSKCRRSMRRPGFRVIERAADGFSMVIEDEGPKGLAAFYSARMR